MGVDSLNHHLPLAIVPRQPRRMERPTSGRQSVHRLGGNDVRHGGVRLVGQPLDVQMTDDVLKPSADDHYPKSTLLAAASPVSASHHIADSRVERR
jgi:hypothetical protein